LSLNKEGVTLKVKESGAVATTADNVGRQITQIKQSLVMFEDKQSPGLG
jgi:hypothetical protein